MINDKEGDSYVNDERVIEFFSKFDPKIGNMGGWRYDPALLDEHVEIIALYCLGWTRCRSHYHDQFDGPRKLEEIKDMYLNGNCSPLLEELANVGDFILTKHFVELEKGDPLRKLPMPHYSLVHVTLNGYQGSSVHDFHSALWHAAVNMAIAKKAQAEKEKCTD